MTTTTCTVRTPCATVIPIGNAVFWIVAIMARGLATVLGTSFNVESLGSNVNSARSWVVRQFVRSDRIHAVGADGRPHECGHYEQTDALPARDYRVRMGKVRVLLTRLDGVWPGTGM